VLSRRRHVIIRRFLLALQTLRIAMHRCKGAALKFVFIVVLPAGADCAGVLELRLSIVVAVRRYAVIPNVGDWVLVDTSGMSQTRPEAEMPRSSADVS
jgi:hypothetical protein